MGEGLSGTVTAFDADRGLGEVTADDGTVLMFHCVSIADGSRTIAVGALVSFDVLLKLGRREAAALPAAMSQRPLERDGRYSRDERHGRILAVIRSLREGEVVTYGEIAADAGFAKMSRLVGHILATVDDELPWWRVVNSTGQLVPGHEREQTFLLKREGVRCAGGKVRTAKYGRFSPQPPQREGS